MNNENDKFEPTVEVRSRADWRLWIIDLVRSGWRRLSALGLTLVLGMVAALLSIWLFAELAEEILEEESIAIDHTVLVWLRTFQSPRLDEAAYGISLLGAETVVVLLAILLVLFWLQRRWGAAFALLLTTGGAQFLNTVLKDLFQRTRPAPVTTLIPAQEFSFPSGHAMVSAAFYLFLAYLGWRLLTGWQRVAFSLFLVSLILLIGLSRLYLGIHYLTDVIAGYIAGFLWVDAVIIGGRLASLRSGRRKA